MGLFTKKFSYDKFFLWWGITCCFTYQRYPAAWTYLVPRPSCSLDSRPLLLPWGPVVMLPWIIQGSLFGCVEFRSTLTSLMFWLILGSNLVWRAPMGAGFDAFVILIDLLNDVNFWLFSVRLRVWCGGRRGWGRVVDGAMWTMFAFGRLG